MSTEKKYAISISNRKSQRFFSVADVGKIIGDNVKEKSRKNAALSNSVDLDRLRL